LKEIERESEERITRKEFLEFAKRTDENFQRVWDSIGAHAEAQRRTEGRVGELVEAQKRTEERLGVLGEGLEALAKAQRRTEEELRKLIEDHRETRRQLGGLARAIGYTLENESYNRALPWLLKRDYGILLKERLRRGYLIDVDGREIEVNIYGEGELDGKRVMIIGECKSQLSKNDIDRFIRKKLEGLRGVVRVDIFPVLVTHMISSKSVEEYAKQKRLALYYSYDFVETS
jgi:hypothetical protein